MASSTLDPDYIPEPDRQLGKGHGTNSLGPSDISDSGSDQQGGLRAIEENTLGLDLGTNEDPTTHNIEPSHESDDSGHTGETMTAGREPDIRLGSDINVDRIDDLPLEDLPEEDLPGADHPGLQAAPPARQDAAPRARR